jgi:hypothetical protein
MVVERQSYCQAIAKKALFVAVLALAPKAYSQSFSLHDPGPMSAGANSATVDSLSGRHYWIFTALPGTFRLVWSYGSAREGVNIRIKPTMSAVYFPKTPGSTLNSKTSSNSIIFTGTVKEPTKVLIEVDPSKSALVRQTSSYTLEATGSVSFPGPVAPTNPPVSGVYTVDMFGEGAAKFAPNGEITSTTGKTGRWEMFDGPSKTYSVIYGEKRYTLTFQPERGFVDNNGQLVFTLKQ